MAISKGSRLMNSNRFITLAVNRYEHKEIQGMLYHENIKNGVSFKSLIEVMKEMEAIFDGMNYPAKSMEVRSFVHDGLRTQAEIRTEVGTEGHETVEDVVCGALATLQICVRKRYNVSWQGHMIWKEQDQTILFDSFLEMIRSINQILGGAEEGSPLRSEEPICRVAIDGYTKLRMQGRITYAAKGKEEAFGSIMELVEQMEVLADCLERKEKAKLPLQICSSYLSYGRVATFLIRLLFQENATWQGIVYWKEAGQRINFRSFLELIQIMDAALTDGDRWNHQKNDKKEII